MEEQSLPPLPEPPMWAVCDDNGEIVRGKYEALREWARSFALEAVRAERERRAIDGVNRAARKRDQHL